jgi:hypothetical protein
MRQRLDQRIASIGMLPFVCLALAVVWVVVVLITGWDPWWIVLAIVLAAAAGSRWLPRR